MPLARACRRDPSVCMRPCRRAKLVNRALERDDLAVDHEVPAGLLGKRIDQLRIAARSVLSIATEQANPHRRHESRAPARRRACARTASPGRRIVCSVSLASMGDCPIGCAVGFSRARSCSARLLERISQVGLGLDCSTVRPLSTDLRSARGRLAPRIGILVLHLDQQPPRRRRGRPAAARSRPQLLAVQMISAWPASSASAMGWDLAVLLGDIVVGAAVPDDHRAAAVDRSGITPSKSA